MGLNEPKAVFNVHAFTQSTKHIKHKVPLIYKNRFFFYFRAENERVKYSNQCWRHHRILGKMPKEKQMMCVRMCARK